MNYSLRQLRIFVAVAEQQSFSRAGELIGLSQSAVSHAVKELEQTLSLRLIDRTTREVVLTLAGKQLASRMALLIDDMDSLIKDLYSYGEQRTGTVRVAASQTISAQLMPKCLASCQQRYPEIRLLLQDSVQQSVVQAVRQEEVDFGIVIELLNTREFETQPLLQDPFLLLCRDDDPLAEKPRVSWGDIAQRQCVLQDYASGSRVLIDAIFQQQGGHPEVVQQVGHPSTLFTMVDAGIGVSILPALALPLPQESQLVVRKISPEKGRLLTLIRRKNRSLSPAAEVIWQLVAEQAQQLAQKRKISVR
ncbi:LysR family transcriptional regulator [Rosenbergiella epipactidis]|uniref:LysR family transcriptional regulator n=1 Tax=Rosenbergiella epipactidis TaxID=1544694 RepID=UPI00066472C9|nr:LysR family transcriptional regulator [Rosenbergiella epipactidis]KMV67342.1 LysR family transcriptional regulator [bacteria symbiont BFo2 of Frankliniella occidentalis]KYP87661.1 LysR family transcriptional regulator [bacteria symbiont BFo2 of Frankliniella occidentalis]KYP95166.1 LysR family transcriptional regulator [bacteria symbiont BFo2 of Frankliniella occidentalis]